MCAQMLKHVTAHEHCTDAIRESAQKVGSGRKIPCHTGESNLPQLHTDLTPLTELHPCHGWRVCCWTWLVGMQVLTAPQLGAADAEIKVPSGENTELKRCPFKAWSRPVYSHTCYAYCQEFLPLFLPFRSVHLHLFQNLSRFLLCWLWLTHDSCVGPQNKTGHPAKCRFLCWVPTDCI